MRNFFFTDDPFSVFFDEMDLFFIVKCTGYREITLLSGMVKPNPRNHDNSTN